MGDVMTLITVVVGIISIDAGGGSTSGYDKFGVVGFGMVGAVFRYYL